MSQRPDRPDFLYIGAAKAGSSWLYKILRSHPDVFIPPAKDVQYFDHQYQLGWEWYAAHFKKAQPHQMRGDISHDYFLSAEYAQRIAQDCPDVKLIACLRNPISRCVSKFTYAQSTIIKNDVSMRDFLLREDMLAEAQYYKNLKPFYDIFPRENIFVYFFDDMVNDPVDLYRRISIFLGIDENFRPDELENKVHVARTVKVEWIAHMAWRLAKLLRKIGLANVVGKIKSNPLYNKVMYSARKEKPTLDPDLEADLVKNLCSDFPELEALLETQLPVSWPRIEQ